MGKSNGNHINKPKLNGGYMYINSQKFLKENFRIQLFDNLLFNSC